MMESWWQVKIEELGEETATVSFCAPQKLRSEWPANKSMRCDKVLEVGTNYNFLMV
jgi:hypothetical protein